MTKGATIASLVRNAARTEDDFQSTVQGVLDDEDHDRIAEFFDRLNIPRSVAGNKVTEPLPILVAKADRIGTFEQEKAISDGIQKYLDRHERKIKWHASHPAMDGLWNVVLLFRCAGAVTELRLQRLQFLLQQKDELTPREWAISRELMNRSYLSFRNFLHLMSRDWVDAMHQTVDREEFANTISTFYEIVDGRVRCLEEFRVKLEERRQELTVIPDGFPPVKPPNYFGGDLMGRGPWTQFWNLVTARAHHFRESVG